MAEFFREVGITRADEPPIGDELPGTAQFPDADAWKLRIDQLTVAKRRLDRLVVPEGLRFPDLPDRLHRPPREQIRQLVLQLHRDILGVLTAANFRLGKAYGMGIALADLTLDPPADERFFRESFGDNGKADGIVETFDDLKTLLPAHAAESVAGSIREWQGWVLENLGQVRGPNWSAVAAALKTQGKRWRALLTGEKRATDFLGIDDYILAGEALLARFRKLTMRFLVQHWLAVVTAVIVIAGVVVLALNFASGTAKFWTVAVWLFGTIGISGATVRSGVRQAAGRIGDGLWGAELDLAIIKAVTALPGNDPSSVAPPPPPLARTNKAYRRTPTGPPTRPLDQTTISSWGPQRTGHKAPAPSRAPR
jgi:hypothetical protein